MAMQPRPPRPQLPHNIKPIHGKPALDAKAAHALAHQRPHPAPQPVHGKPTLDAKAARALLHRHLPIAPSDKK